MSDYSCDACSSLREDAPDFVQNGVTTSICASLANDTGLNPNLTVLHTDAEDLHDANDCLIGRMGEEVDSYDVCDWKLFMKRFISNLYETLKAIICALGGIWSKIHTLEDSTESICENAKELMESFAGVLPTITGTTVNPNIVRNSDTTLANPGFQIWADHKKVTFCSETTEAGRVGIHCTGGIHTDTALVVNDVLATWDQNVLVPTYMTAQKFNDIMSYGHQAPLAMMGGDTIVYGFLASHSSYPGKLVLTVYAIVGGSAVGRFHSLVSTIEPYTHS